MDEVDSQEEDVGASLGSILRVRRVDSESGRVWFERRDGVSGWFPVGMVDDVEAGQILYMPRDIRDDDPVFELSESDWLVRGGDVGVVSLVSEDGKTAVVESNGHHQTFPQREPNPLIKGQTIAIDHNGQPGVVISEKPLERFGRVEEDDDPGRFVVEPGDIKVEDFGGSSALVSRAFELVRVALDPEARLEQIGVNPIKGILFSGPSGTGKTHLARVICNEFSARFYLVDGPEIINKWVGESEQRLRNLFKDAERNAPSILFFDELDSIVSRRGDDAPEYATRFVGQFLTTLDGFQANRGVLVIATTNLPGALDSALLRPGRLTFRLDFDGRPSPEDRLSILRASARGVRFSESPDWPDVVAQTEGWSAAEMALIWTEAGVLTALDGRSEICAEDVATGLARATVNRNLSPNPKGGN